MSSKSSLKVSQKAISAMSNPDKSARIVLGLMTVFLILFIIGFILTTVSDDSFGAQRVNDITQIAQDVNAGNVTEINQRSDTQIIIFLRSGERQLFSRSTNSAMSALLQGAGVDAATLNSLNFTTGEQSNSMTTVGGILRLIGLAGLGVTAVLGYLQRRRQVLASRRLLR